jgi:hypothetical protein
MNPCCCECKKPLLVAEELADLLAKDNAYKTKHELTEPWMFEAFTHLSVTSACYEDVLDGSTPMCRQCFEALSSEVLIKLHFAFEKALRRLENRKRRIIECK